MAEILEFKPKKETPAEDMALVCLCGGMRWFLVSNGQIECAKCNHVMPGTWDFDSHDD